MLRLERTTSDDPSFQHLVRLLDEELRNRYGQEMNNYDPHNKIQNNKHVVIAYIDNTAVGCACFKFFNETSVELKRMYVQREYRGQKVAENIITELEYWAKEIGYSTVVLETGVKQPEAIRLYERCNYTRIDNFEPYVGMTRSICMKKDI